MENIKSELNKSLDKQLIIFQNGFLEFDEKIIVDLSKKKEKIIEKEAKKNCKIIKFEFEYDLHQIITTIASLNHQEYTNLFIFIISLKNVRFLSVKTKNTNVVEIIKQCLLKFGESRPLILQLTSEDEMLTNIYYKDGISDNFLIIEQSRNDFENTIDFPSFLRSLLTGKIRNFDEIFETKFSQLKDSTLILTFLRTLSMSNQLFNQVIEKVISKCGSTTDFLAIMDIPFDGNLRNLSINSLNNFSNKMFPAEGDNWDSILVTAIKSCNTSVASYLINSWTHLIQQFSDENQVVISTLAFENNQFDILCDLLDIADFPFPEDFTADKHHVNQERFNTLIKKRNDFQNAIKNENYIEIDKFIDNNLNLNIIYNCVNKSALQQSVDAKQYKVYFHLKSNGLIATEFDVIENVVNEKEELEKISILKLDRRRKNTQNASSEDQKSINLLCNRSFIHNIKIGRDKEAENRQKIRQWYTDINKISSGKELLNVVASCEQIKIIFDFECNSVENVSLQGPETLGSMYSASKWIFVGAKLSGRNGSENKQRDQKIKGVLAHELCHYAMKLVYENKENPYYKIMIKMAEMFEEIVKSIDKWSAEDAENPDDECNEIISGVYVFYDLNNYHPELIVRAIQMLAEFDNDSQKIIHLQDKYKMLFDFWEMYVVPDMIKFNSRIREQIRKLNNYCEVLPAIKRQDIEFSKPQLEEKLNKIENFIKNKSSIITSNVPKLLLSNIYKYLLKDFGSMLDTENIFVSSSTIGKDSEIYKDLEKVLAVKLDLNIFVECSEKPENDRDHLIQLAMLKKYKNVNIFFIISRGCKIPFREDFSPEKVDMNYNWSDLAEQDQKKMMNTKVIFQNNSQLSLMDLLKEDTSHLNEISETLNDKLEKKILEDFSDIADDQILNLLTENKTVSINREGEVNMTEKYFDILYKDRHYIKKLKNSKIKSNISHDELLKDVKNKQYALISDKAGTGKSWVMKKLTRSFLASDQMKWVTYVDLKQYIKDFVVHEKKNLNPVFSTFMIDNILKPKQKFEGKFFHNFYKSGKVFILFDGFDEIAPNCAEFVSKLAQNFKQHGGNQLWIATRDYFEIDIQNDLKIDIAYSLDEFTVEFGVELIATSWLLKDPEYENLSDDNLDHLKESQSAKYHEHKTRALEIVHKVKGLTTRSIGLPQLFTMIIDVFNDSNDEDQIFTLFIVYEKFVMNLFTIWSRKKGKIREAGSNAAYQYELSFWRFNQYSALESYFPGCKKFCDLIFHKPEWPEEEIIGCGFMTKNGDKYSFIHETFREFFVAYFIIRMLKINRIDEDFFKVLIPVLTRREFIIVRVFLNDKWTDCEKIQTKIQGMIEKLYNMESFADFFTKNLDKLTELMTNVLKKGKYVEIKKILVNSSQEIATDTTNSDLFSKFWKFLLNYLKLNDLKTVLVDYEIIQRLAQSSLEISVIKSSLSQIEDKTNIEFVKKCLKLMSKENWNGNIFDRLCWSSDLNGQKIKEFIEMTQTYLDRPEIIELMVKCNSYGQNILHVVIRTGNKDKLLSVWTEVNNFLEQEPQKFKELVTNEAIFGRNILHYSSYCDDVNFHETFWILLSTAFTDLAELKKLLVNNDQLTNNFARYLIESKKSVEIMKLTFKILKSKIGDEQFNKILKSRNRQGQNLLMIATIRSTDIQTHQFLWEIFKSDAKYHEIIKQVDNDCCNVLHLAASSSTADIFEYLLSQLNEKIVKELLVNVDKNLFNVLQISAMANKSIKLHELLWLIIHKYFNKSEITKLIQNVNKNGENLFFIAIQHSTKEIVEFIWNQIKNVLNQDEQDEYLRKNRKDGKNILNLISSKEIFSEISECVQDIIREYDV